MNERRTPRPSHALSADALAAMFARLAQSMRVVAPTERDGRFAYAPVDRFEEVRLDFDTTVLPPTVHLLPAKELLLRVRLGEAGSAEQVVDDLPTALFGVHPYDLRAIELLDEAFLGTRPDPHYAARRRNLLIVGIDCLHPSATSFAPSMGTQVATSGFDLLLTDIGEAHVVTVGSDRGASTIDGLPGLRAATDAEIAEVGAQRDAATARFLVELDVPRERVARLLVDHYDDPYWEERSNTCLSCGSCVMVCPTCFCFDVADDVGLDLTSSSRVRRWDGCMLSDFARVAGGENFRATSAGRFRHRMLRKGKYLMERYGVVGCVGCGRCATACLSEIASPAEAWNAIANIDRERREEQRAAAVDGSFVPQSVSLGRVVSLADKEKLFVLGLPGGRGIGHMPGQFVMLSVPGVGEAPISISSSPTREGTLDLAIRDVGNVTHAIHGLEVGAHVGIRGPFGNGFPIDALEWKDLVLVAGGIGLFPLRSLIQYVLDRRERFGEMTVLYGARTPADRLFVDELDQWAARDDLRLLQTVDHGAEGWDGPVGLITTLISPLEIEPAKTMAVVVGPPVMYRFVIAELKKKGLGDNQIILSLERHMKCGTGKCGHCQINGLTVCQDGPVFTLAQLRELPEAVQ